MINSGSIITMYPDAAKLKEETITTYIQLAEVVVDDCIPTGAYDLAVTLLASHECYLLQTDGSLSGGKVTEVGNGNAKKKFTDRNTTKGLESYESTPFGKNYIKLLEKYCSGGVYFAGC